jgi:phage gpG-like protein
MTTPLINIGFNPHPVTTVFGQVLRRMGGKPALMREVAGIMLDEVEENFAQQGRPKWVDIQSVSLKRAGFTKTKSGKSIFLKRNTKPGYSILQDSGRLAASITSAFDASSATVGTNVLYAAIQHFGGKTKAHIIRAKNAKALAFGGVFRKSVNHPGSKIPARPFLTVSPAGEQKIVRAGEAFLRGVIGG